MERNSRRSSRENNLCGAIGSAEEGEIPLDFFWGAKRPWGFLTAGPFLDGAFEGAVDLLEALIEELTSLPIESAEFGEVAVVEVVLGRGDISGLVESLDVLDALGLGFGFLRRDLTGLGICTYVG
jgi:hypothetical protein